MIILRLLCVYKTMENKDCSICASPYTSYMRKRLKCEYCDFEACKECCSTYLLNVGKPGCMNNSCTGEWSREFISDNLTKVFANTKLRQHKAEMLFQEQLSHMMESQLEIEEEKRQAKIMLKIRSLHLWTLKTPIFYKLIFVKNI
jgi:hypothetical protein